MAADRGTRRDAGGRVRYRTTGPAPRAGLSALPSTLARALAFASIIVGGACGALIGYGVVRVQCTDGDCGTAEAVAAVIGGIFVAGGVAVVAVLVLRAMGEWRSLDRRRDVAASRTAGRGDVPPTGRDSTGPADGD